MASFRHFAWRFFVISSFCVASFRYFVFSRGVFSLFRYFALRYFVFSRGVISLFCVALFRGKKTKRRNGTNQKWCGHSSNFIFCWIFFILAGNEDNRNSLDEFEFTVGFHH